MNEEFLKFKSGTQEVHYQTLSVYIYIKATSFYVFVYFRYSVD